MWVPTPYMSEYLSPKADRTVSHPVVRVQNIMAKTINNNDDDDNNNNNNKNKYHGGADH